MSLPEANSYVKNIVEIVGSAGGRRGRREDKWQWLTLRHAYSRARAVARGYKLYHSSVCGRHCHYNNHGRSAFEGAIVLVRTEHSHVGVWIPYGKWQKKCGARINTTPPLSRSVEERRQASKRPHKETRIVFSKMNCFRFGFKRWIAIMLIFVLKISPYRISDVFTIYSQSKYSIVQYIEPNVPGTFFFVKK